MGKWLKGVFNSEKNSLTDVVAFLTFALTGVAFLFREFYYLYQWGFYSSIGIDKRYINVETASDMYHIFLYVGFAGIFLISNYITYSFVGNKNWGLFAIFLLVEKIFLWIVVIVFSNVEYSAVLKGMISSEYYKGYMRNGLILFLIVIAINAYGLAFGISNIVCKKGTEDYSVKGSLWGNILHGGFKTIAQAAGMVLLIILVEGIAILCIGTKDGYDKVDFKIIVEPVFDSEEQDSQYVFEEDNRKVKVYPILYENNEVYLVSKLYKGAEGNDIEDINQKVISKVGVETEYVDNIYEFGQETEKSENNNTVKEQIAGGESKEGGNKMLNTIVGVVLGAILTFFVGRYQDNKKEKKRRSHAASLLYYDLLSIEYYLAKERSSVNIRYTNDWQTMVTNCDFLKDEQVQCLYSIYDLVYNYNYHYGLQEKEQGAVVKESICQYETLNEIFFDTSKEYCDKKVANEEYGKILKALQVHM